MLLKRGTLGGLPNKGGTDGCSQEVEETSPKTVEAHQATAPAFPYSNKPGSLRRFLDEVPKKPKPNKVNAPMLRAWGFGDTNDQSVIRVLKAVGLVAPSNEPTDLYAEYMKVGTGPQALGRAVRTLYSKIFEHSHAPHTEPETTLRNYFNIHSGGSESTINLQILTFKALCDHSRFDDDVAGATAVPTAPRHGAAPTSAAPHTADLAMPGIRIDLHIHLPENKSRRDYEYMFEDIEQPHQDGGAAVLF